MNITKKKEQLLIENEELRKRLEEAEETLRAIREGEVDALVVSGAEGEQLYTLKGADYSYRILLETMEEGAATVGEDGTILYCNGRMAAMLRTPLNKVMGFSLEEYLSDDQGEILRKMFPNGDPVKGREESYLKAADGTRVPVLLSFGSMQIGDVRSACLTATDLAVQKRAEENLRKAHDELEIRVQERTQELIIANQALQSEIAERKRTEEALRLSEKRWATTLASIGDAVIATDTAGKITFMNAVAEGLTGWGLREASQRPVSEVFHIINEYTHQMVEDPVVKVIKAGAIVGLANHTILVKKDGAEVPIDDSGAPIIDGDGKVMGVVLVFRDITDRKQAEETLRESEERYRQLVRHAPAGIYEVDFTTGRFTEVNDVMSRILGYTHDELLAMTPFDILDDEGKAHFASRIRLARSGERPAEAAEYLVRTKDGRLIWALLNVTFRWDAGKIVGATVVAHDITERKRVELEKQLLLDAVQAEKDKLSALVNSISDEVWFADINKKFTLANPSAIREFGLVSQEVDVEKMAATLEVYRPDGTPRPVGEAPSLRALNGELVRNLEEIIRTPASGELRHRQVNAAPVRDAHGNIMGSVSVVRDITERKRMEEDLRRSHNELETRVRERTAELAGANKGLQEEIVKREKAEQQLRQAQKLEAIGTLTGGIAHDFNNILGPIVINSEMALLDLPGESSLRGYLDLILKAGLRGKDLVKQMLLFSRKSEPKQEVLTLTPLINETFKLLRSSLPTTIQMKLLLEIESDAVYADASQIQQVIMNLCTNAAYAMRGTTGSIDICLQDTSFSADDLPEAEMQPGDYLVLSVKDTGSGMDEEVRKRIFEPFFTTKPVGEGTGLGLSVVYGIVKNHKGTITVYSEPGKGSIFRVYLPEVGIRTSVATEAPTPTPRGNERILLVDDEDYNIKTVQNMLQHLGYKVTALMDSQEALRLFYENPSQFDLVITDQTMPFLTGEDLGKELMRMRPDIPVILCTGYSDLISSEKATALGFRGYIMKPFTVREGAELVRRVLDQKEPGNFKKNL